MQTNDEKEIWFFLSHSNKDFEKVRTIRNYLEEKGCRPLMFFLKCLSNDDEINELIKREIDCRLRFVICDSENARMSKWVQSEVAYIKSKDRAYEVLDLNSSESEIREKLDLLVKHTRAFISYSRNDFSFVKSVLDVIRQYDIRFFWDVVDILSGTCNFKKQISEAINSTGQFLLFGSKRYFRSQFCREELKFAINHGKAIRIVWLEKPSECVLEEDEFQFKKMPTLAADSQVDLSDIESLQEKKDAAIEAIVNWFMPCWDVYTMANNFLHGTGCPANVAEAERLFGIAYRKAGELDARGYPGGTLVLARCLANGYGTEKDLREAFANYRNYIRTVGPSPEVGKEIEQVRKLLGETSCS